MPAIVVKGGTLLALGRSNAVHSPGALRIEGGAITHVGSPADVPLRGADEIDLGEAVLLPGLLNAHTHLYSSLARGLPARGPAPRSFREILEGLWWRWDKLLDEEAVRRNAEAGLLESVRCGVTAVNDHHASPNAVVGSLDTIAEAALAIGLRVALAYETSERDGRGVLEKGLEENRRFAARAAADRSGLLAATVGAHASLTLGDESLERLASLSREIERPVHLHMDEGPEDREGARRGGDRSTAERLARTGVLREGTLLAHAVHVDEEDIALLARARAIVLHNPRSNGANAVGLTPVPALLRAGVRVAVGTDGMSADVAADASVAGALHRTAEKDRSIPFDLPLRLAGRENAALASRLFGKPFGELAVGFAGDVVARRYDPPTPVRPETVAAHWILGLGTAPVSDVFVAGERILVRGEFVRVNEREILEACRAAAERIWKAFHA